MDTIHVGILGLGFMGMTHAKNLLKLKHVDIKGVCGLTLEEAEEFSQTHTHGKAKAFADFDYMLEDVNMDVLFICLPPFAHHGQLEAAARKGIHIFAEKPIALQLDQAKAMVDTVNASGVLSCVGYHMRQGVAVEKLKAMIDDGRAGIPTLFDGRFACHSLHTPWWIDREKSGGQILEQAIHLYDLAMYFMGEAEWVTGVMGNLCHTHVANYTVEDTSTAIIKFESGAIGNIAASNCAVPWEWQSIFTVICEHVTVHFKDANNAEFIYTNGEETTREWVLDNRDMYYQEVETFIHAVKEGKQNGLCGIHDGYRSLQLVDAVVKSAEKSSEKVTLKN
ncbi:Gfo/Idh/MocA family oxidoreductase [Vallitalea pronyensis]|uniref:Gfo/Idh/MocA family oxidoreductase n=1 Tax=Vallitalea pronyensis TaxID=1348613 RepID=A0A8J8MG85_9FIRM|nr:Gfo/Idh/MocA family oxidoreductase [Vallitalea pronyensis]QUI21024.1 Gfo/Idh/MocA family oxidoreductase [Vallitalea pronyensis]